jgi:3-hydroxyisobutyrate dehydrogenase
VTHIETATLWRVHDRGGVDIGFIGLGNMGEPMALNLAEAGIHLVVWNRTRSKTQSLEAAGARVAVGVSGVFAQVRTILLMLVDGDAIDAVLGRGTLEFAERVQDRTIVHMGTTSAG